jgi:hypothetical protein
MEAIADDERDPKTLAALAAPCVKVGRTGIEQVLDGMQLGSHHPMLIRLHLNRVARLDGPSPRSRTRLRPP